jgi:phage terminase large subunit-like protein
LVLRTRHGKKVIGKPKAGFSVHSSLKHGRLDLLGQYSSLEPLTAGQRKELLEEDLSPLERARLFWKPEDLVYRDRAEVFAQKNLLMSLSDFVREAWKVLEPATPLLWNWHIDVICAHLEAVSAGEIRRLLINVPPGHMKSLLVSVFWPAWVWAHLPEWRVLCASSGLSLATRDSGKCKDLITSPWYQYAFRPKWQIKRDSKAKASYQNDRYGLRHAVSVGAATTGFRGNALLIDDPLQVMQAYSDPARQESVDWVDKAAASRLADPRHDAIVIIMQRVHWEDPAGHVLRQTKDKYEHVSLPSYFEKASAFRTVLADTERWMQFGSDPRKQERELLFPELFTEDVLVGAEETMGDLEFAGQHQQRPTPAAGNMFKAEYFCQDKEGKAFWPHDVLFDPAQLIEAYLCWDTAAKKGVANDFGAGVLIARARDGHSYIAPLVLEKMDTTDVEKKVLLTWATWKKRLGGILQGAPIEEGASNATAVVQHARRMMSHRREREMAYEQFIARGGDPGRFDWKAPPDWTLEEWELVCSAPQFHPLPFSPRPMKKEQRARGVLSYCKGRNARMVALDEYVTRQWMGQLLAFPLAKNDDAVDAMVTGLEFMAGLSDNEPFIDGDELTACEYEPLLSSPVAGPANIVDNALISSAPASASARRAHVQRAPDTPSKPPTGSDDHISIYDSL